jgi:hypothetical protein
VLLLMTACYSVAGGAVLGIYALYLISSRWLLFADVLMIPMALIVVCFIGMGTSVLMGLPEEIEERRKRGWR